MKLATLFLLGATLVAGQFNDNGNLVAGMCEVDAAGACGSAGNCTADGVGYCCDGGRDV